MTYKQLKEMLDKLSEEQLKTVDDPKYMGVNTFTLGPKSIYKGELVGLYVNVIPRKSRL